MWARKCPYLSISYMKDKEYKKEQKRIKATQRKLERLADEMLRKDEEAQKLREFGKNIDPNKFKKLF